MRVRREPGHVLVTVAGEIDIATVAQLEKQLSALAVAGEVVLADLTQVSFIDAAGLRALGQAAGQAAEHGGRLHVICGRDHILRLFHLTGLDRRIAVVRTLTEALRVDQRS
jgi:anti-sigma B factor antagonist